MHGKVERFSTFQRLRVERSQNTTALPPLVCRTDIAEPLKKGEVSCISHSIFPIGIVRCLRNRIPLLIYRILLLNVYSKL